MRYILYCDGACEPNPGQMAYGFILKERTGDKENTNDKIIKEVAEKLGSGTNNKAEYFAIIKGMDSVKTMWEQGGGIPGLEMIVVLSDSQLAINQIKGSYKTKDTELWGLKGQVIGIERFFDKVKIPVYYFWQQYIGAAHDLSQKALFGDKYDLHKRKEYLYDMIARGIRMVPLSVFRRKEWESLTISEALVYELIENEKLSFKDAAKELDRGYETIRTQYRRAKIKIK